MRSVTRNAILAIIIANILLVLVAVCGKILTRFDYKDHFDDIVISVDGENIALREFGYYIFQVEAFVQRQALSYDPENPKLWWNTHFSAGLDSQFVCDYAKKVAVNTCICDQIYYAEATHSDFVLDEASNARINNESKEIFESMTSSQLAATGLTQEDIIKMHRKHVIASEYAESLATKLDFHGYNKEPRELLNWDGEYYEEEILPMHEIGRNDNILDNITLGKITVNS